MTPERSPRPLVVFYSRSGHTRRLAEALTNALHADIEEIWDGEKRTGWRGYVRSARQAFRERPAQIEPTTRDLTAYDLVLVGGPVWMMSVSPPVRTFLRHHAAQLPRVAFFATYGGQGLVRAFDQMTDELGRPPLATLGLREDDIRRGAPHIEAKIEPFVRTLTQGPVTAEEAGAEPEWVPPPRASRATAGGT